MRSGALGYHLLTKDLLAAASFPVRDLLGLEFTPCRAGFQGDYLQRMFMEEYLFHWHVYHQLVLDSHATDAPRWICSVMPVVALDQYSHQSG